MKKLTCLLAILTLTSCTKMQNSVLADAADKIQCPEPTIESVIETSNRIADYATRFKTEPEKVKQELKQAFLANPTELVCYYKTLHEVLRSLETERCLSKRRPSS
jgi:hypothetical protein